MGVYGSVAERWRNRAEYRRTRRSYGEWKTEHPEASFADFYVADTIDKIARGKSPPYTVGLHVDCEWAARRASRVVEMMRADGLAPNHVCVDYGCGSLWIGEALMRYLDPGRYVGLDVTDRFYEEGLARLSPEFVAEKRPVLRIISEESLEEIRAREPDYVISSEVLMHVPPDELVAFFGSIVRLAAPHTRIVVTGKTGLCTSRPNPRSWRHSRRAIQASLAELGFEARFPRRSRSAHPRVNGIVIVRRERDG
jgi:hypothetical protein